MTRILNSLQAIVAILLFISCSRDSIILDEPVLPEPTIQDSVPDGFVKRKFHLKLVDGCETRTDEADIRQLNLPLWGLYSWWNDNTGDFYDTGYLYLQYAVYDRNPKDWSEEEKARICSADEYVENYGGGDPEVLNNLPFPTLGVGKLIASSVARERQYYWDDYPEIVFPSLGREIEVEILIPADASDNLKILCWADKGGYILNPEMAVVSLNRDLVGAEDRSEWYRNMFDNLSQLSDAFYCYENLTEETECLTLHRPFEQVNVVYQEDEEYTWKDENDTETVDYRDNRILSNYEIALSYENSDSGAVTGEIKLFPYAYAVNEDIIYWFDSGSSTEHPYFKVDWTYSWRRYPDIAEADIAGKDYKYLGVWYVFANRLPRRTCRMVSEIDEHGWDKDRMIPFYNIILTLRNQKDGRTYDTYVDINSWGASDGVIARQNNRRTVIVNTNSLEGDFD